MPTTEAYRPGLLSSLLLGTETEGAGAEGAAAATKHVVPAAAVSGAAPPADDEDQARTSTKKKKKKTKKAKRGVEEPGSPTTDVVVASPKEKQWPVAAAAPLPAEGVEGLASLFSPGNLKKFKRRERADKDADAAEVETCGCSGVRFVRVLWLK